MRFDNFIWSGDIYFDEIHNKINNTIQFNEFNTNMLNKLSKDKKVVFEEILDNTLYVPGFGDYCHYKYINYQLFYHAISILYKMSMFYNDLPKLFYYCITNNIANKGAVIEYILYIFLTSNNINYKNTNISGLFITDLN